MTLLVLDHVSAGYGDIDIIHEISLIVGKGEIVTIAGPNGAGKSTLVRAVVGLAPRCSGKITFDGYDLDRDALEERARRGISYVPQVANVFPSLSVIENLQVVENVPHRTQRVQEMFRIFPVLAARKHMRAEYLSGGERQRLAFARALMPHPLLLLLDEPTASLAPSAVCEVFQLIADLPTLGVAALVIEQRARQSLEISDRGYILDTGRIVLSGAAKDLLMNAKMTDLYLGKH